MNTKICSKCGIEKELSEFYKREVSKDGMNPKCKTCCYIKSDRLKKTQEDKKNDSRKYYEEHREGLKLASKNRYQKNKEELSEKAKVKRNSRTSEEKLSDSNNMKNYYEENKDEIKKKMKTYGHNHYIENKDKIDTRHKEYRIINNDKIKLHTKEYYKNNKQRFKQYAELNEERIRLTQQLYHKNNKEKVNKKRKDKYHSNINFKLQDRLRSRLRQAIKCKYRSGSAVRDLGCTIDEFIIYIENQFQEGMSWENYGKNGWSLDHIIPLSVFDLSDRNEFLKACHFSNMQPLWSDENFRKSDKILPEHIEKARQLGIQI